MKKLLALTLALAGLSGAASADQIGPSTGTTTLTMTLPLALVLDISTTAVVFDFSSAGSLNTTVPFDTAAQPQANEANYKAFLVNGTFANPTNFFGNFGPTRTVSSAGTETANPKTRATITSNNMDWKLTVADAPLAANTFFPGGYFPAALTNVKSVFVSKTNSLQASTGVPGNVDALSNDPIIAQASSNGGGTTVYDIFYSMSMNRNQSFNFPTGTTDVTYSQALTYTLANP